MITIRIYMEESRAVLIRGEAREKRRTAAAAGTAAGIVCKWQRGKLPFPVRRNG